MIILLALSDTYEIARLKVEEQQSCIFLYHCILKSPPRTLHYFLRNKYS
jgi:hypothetical protein